MEGRGNYECRNVRFVVVVAAAAAAVVYALLSFGSG